MVDPKQHLRQRLSVARRTLPAVLRQRWSQSLCLLARRFLGNAPRGPVAIFWPTASEPDLTPVFKHWFAVGSTLVLPALIDGVWQWRHARSLPSADVSPCALPKDQLGGALQPEVALVPAVACDRLGRRLGQGGGIYDRLLASIELSFAFIFPFQLVAKVPQDCWDRRVSCVVTPTKVIWTPERDYNLVRS